LRAEFQGAAACCHSQLSLLGEALSEPNHSPFQSWLRVRRSEALVLSPAAPCSPAARSKEREARGERAPLGGALILLSFGIAAGSPGDVFPNSPRFCSEGFWLSAPYYESKSLVKRLVGEAISPPFLYARIMVREVLPAGILRLF
jgi:hypothetical protein